VPRGLPAAAPATISRVPFLPDEPVQLEQVGRNTFRLLRGFTYVDRYGDPHRIEPEKVGLTDLASVPWILWWFVASYGRHTRPALVHDQLVDEIDRHRADLIFRHALEEVGVGWLRRWLVWTAVSFETTFRTLGRGDRYRRRGRHITAIGFLLVTAHLLVGVGATVVTLDALWPWQVGAQALLASWLVAWRERGLLFLLGFVLIAPATTVLLVPLVLVWTLEGGPLPYLRLALWYLGGRRRGEARPDVPRIEPTVDVGLERV
jgi:hypothetical protein